MSWSSAAKRHRVACTFEIVRGTNERRAAGTSERDLVIAGGLARPIAGHFRVEHRRWWSFEAAAGPFLLARGLWTAPGSVVTLLRGRDAAAARLFDMAAQIAAATDSLLAVLCTPALAGDGRDRALDRRTRGDAPGPGPDRSGTGGTGRAARTACPARLPHDRI